MRRLLALLALIAAAVLVAIPALAQQPPYGSFSTEKTGTITATGTYQSVLSASQNGARKSCTIMNTGSHTMLVFFGSSQPANNAGVGYQLAPTATGGSGGWITCGLVGGGVALDQVWIEGTSGDTFEYSSQP